MDERAVIGRTQRPHTVESLAADLRALGVREGATMIVHASLSSIGWVAGAAHAVVLALEEALGSDGTLVMPTHSGANSDPARWRNPPVPEAWWPTIRDHMPAFDPATTPTRGMGAIAECFRTRQGALRSTHPQVSFAARGPAAERITHGHSLALGLGERSPLARVYELDGSVLLLGAGYDSCTSAHLAEYRCTWPGQHTFTTGAAVRVDGERRWVTFSDIEADNDDFDKLGSDFEAATDVVRRGAVGEATARLFPQRALVDFAVGWLAENRRG